MKILHYSLGISPFRSGGMTKYCEDLMEAESRDKNDVYLLYPGAYTFSFRRKKKIKIVYDRKEDYMLCEMKNPLPVSLGFGIDDPERYRDLRETSALYNFLRKLRPDIIHIHTFMGLPKEFLDYAHLLKIKIIYTTHDYYGLCPKILNQKETLKELRNHTCDENCMLCPKGLSNKKIVLMQSHTFRNLKNFSLVKALRKIEKKNVKNVNTNIKKENIKYAEEALELRNYYLDMFKMVDKFHFNSTTAQKIYGRFGLHNGEVIPITVKGIEDRRKIDETSSDFKDMLKIAYVGEYSRKKGFYLFKDLIKKINKIDNNLNKVNFEFWGDSKEDNIFSESNVNNHGKYAHSEIGDIYKNIDILIVPSIWDETFNLVSLEALSYGVPVIMSDKVGAKDLYEKHQKDYVFTCKNDLSHMVRNLINNKAVLSTLRENLQKIDIPFSESEHEQKIIKLYTRVM
jgi:glycosyltransferase involved in cell wall biosynthesis